MELIRICHFDKLFVFLVLPLAGPWSSVKPFLAADGALRRAHYPTGLCGASHCPQESLWDGDVVVGVKLIHILSDEFLYRVAIVVGIDMLLKNISKSALVLFLGFAKLKECTKISVTALLI
jgi:hypothetical protein